MQEFFSKWLYRLIFLGFVILAAWVLYRLYVMYSPTVAEIDRRLPILFHARRNPWVFYAWVLGLGVAAGISFWSFRARTRPTEEIAEENAPGTGGFGSIEAPVGSAPSDQVHVFLGRDPSQVDTLLAAAGLPSRDRAVFTTQPVRAILLNAAGLEESGPGGEGSTSIQAIARSLLERDPEAPPLRGITVVLSWEALISSEVKSLGRETRRALDRFRDTLKLRCPVYLVVTGMERVPGFLEYANAKGPHEAAQGRLGITLDLGRGEERLGPRLVAASDRLRRFILDKMAENVLERDVHARLFGFERRIRLLRDGLMRFREEAFPDADFDRAFLRGIDFVAAGTNPGERAHAIAAVILPLAEDRGATSWTARALEEDRAFRRRAGSIASWGLVAAALVWLDVLLALRSLGAGGVVAASAWAVAVVVVGCLMLRAWPRAEGPRLNRSEPREVGRLRAEARRRR